MATGQPPSTRPIDLHAHTTASDGTLSPTALVELAAKKGLSALAITDHDHVGGLAEARSAGERVGVEIIAGIELSVTHALGDVHLLGYLLDDTHPELLARLDGFRIERARRAERIVEKLQALGVEVTMDDVRRAAGENAGALGRPHVARALHEKRIVTSVKDAFDKWLSDEGPAFVPKAKLSAVDAIGLVHDAGGVAVLAHPGLLPEKGRVRLIRELHASGLDGLEIDHSRHTSEMRRELRALATELSLVPTGGSDFHGENKPDVDLGRGVGQNVRVEYATLDALRARRAAKR